MDEQEIKQLREDVSRSGFPFQRKIRRLIDSSTSEHGWKVESPEHAWVDLDSGEDGFIDLIVSHQINIFKFVVECKRPLGGRWIFLVSKSAPEASRIRAFWTVINDNGWYDFYYNPPSIEAEDCIVRGQDKQLPMLERLSGDLLRSLGAVALQEQQIREREGLGFPRIYIPMIITTADLFVCRADEDEDITMDGRIMETAEFLPVPFVRFRKSLVTRLSPDAEPQNLPEENLDKQRSVLIVNNENLIQILKSFATDPAPPFDFHLPWRRSDWS